MKLLKPPIPLYEDEKISEDEKKVRKSLRNSIFDGMAWSGMDGFGNRFVSAFAVALKATNFQIGVLTSLPNLASSWIQLFSGKLLAVSRNRKKLVLWYALLQALTWIPIALTPFLWPNLAIIALIAFYTLFAVFGAVIGPIWLSLMGDLVPENQRGRYFGYRNKLVVTAGFAALLAAGFLLNLFPQNLVFYGFAVLFFIAFAFRMLSWIFLNKMHEPLYREEPTAYFSFFNFVKSLPKSNFAHFTMFISLLNLAVNIGAPFVVVYWLRVLNFSYIELTIALLFGIVGNFLTYTYWGALTDRFGSKKIMIVTGALVPWAILFYIFFPNPLWIFFVEFFAGFSWAGFNLSASNFMYDSVTAQKRAYAFGYHNVFNGTAVFIGAIIGGTLISFIPDGFIFASAFLTLFLISGILRYLVYFLMIGKVKEVREAEKISSKAMFMVVARTNPINGFAFRGISFARKGVKEVEGSVKWFFKEVEKIDEDTLRESVKWFFREIEKIDDVPVRGARRIRKRFIERLKKKKKEK